MSYMFVAGRHNCLLVVMTREDGYASMEQLRSADIEESRTCETKNACPLALWRSDVQDGAFHWFNHFFLSSLHGALCSTRL